MVAAEEHRLSARALTAITGIRRLRIDDIIGELSVWARVWADRVGHLKSDNKPRRFSIVEVTAIPPCPSLVSGTYLKKTMNSQNEYVPAPDSSVGRAEDCRLVYSAA